MSGSLCRGAKKVLNGVAVRVHTTENDCSSTYEADDETHFQGSGHTAGARCREETLALNSGWFRGGAERQGVVRSAFPNPSRQPPEGFATAVASPSFPPFLTGIFRGAAHGVQLKVAGSRQRAGALADARATDWQRRCQ